MTGGCFERSYNQTFRNSAVTDSLLHLLKGRLAFSLFVDRFRRSLLFCHLEFGKEAISHVLIAHSRVFKGEGGL